MVGVDKIGFAELKVRTANRPALEARRFWVNSFRVALSRWLKKGTQHHRVSFLGEGVVEISRQLSVPKSTVRNWKRQLDPDELTQVNAKSAEAVEDLVVDYLVMSLKALRAQAEVSGDKKYRFTRTFDDTRLDLFKSI